MLRTFSCKWKLYMTFCDKEKKYYAGNIYYRNILKHNKIHETKVWVALAE